MTIRFLGPIAQSGARAFDTDVLAWEASVITNGGSVSLARRIITDQFVFSEKSNGLWNLTDDYWVFWGENAPQALTSLKQRRLATAVNAPTFTADRDYTTDGITSYVDTNFIPSTHATLASANDLHFSNYIRDTGAVSTTAHSSGASAASSRALRIRPRTSALRASLEILTGNTPSDYTLTVATSAGYLSGGRDAASAANYYNYKNGVALVVNNAPIAFGATLTNVSIFVGGYNAAGDLTGPRATSMGFMSFGRCLTAGQEATRYTNVQTFATSVGAQV